MSRVAVVLQVLGVLAVVAGCAAVAWQAGVVAAGVVLVVLGVGLEGGD